MLSSLKIPERSKILPETWRVFKNVIDKLKATKLYGITYVDAVMEKDIDGRPDVIIYANVRGREIPFLVVETKRLEKGKPNPLIDPYNPKVIDQAAGYAIKLGAPYFATFNGEIFVLFETFKLGVPLPQRKLRHYDVKLKITEEFARKILEDLAKIHAGILGWQELDETFIHRLRYFHRILSGPLYQSLKYKLATDPRFRERWESWLKKQLFDVNEETNRKFAEQYAYLLMNRLLFYKTLEVYQRAKIPRLRPVEVFSGKELQEYLRKHFDYVLNYVDYAAIYARTMFDEIPIPDELIPIILEFIEELESYNLADIKREVIGRVYEYLIEPQEKHRLGQYYTPSPVVKLIVNLSIEKPSDKVLDPACGSGGFLVEAYRRLLDLKLKENPLADRHKLHVEILDQLVGIDINQFAAQLAAINLAIQDLNAPSDNMRIIVADFFRVPISGLNKWMDVTVKAVTLNGIEVKPLRLGEFDALVTNPPYTDFREMTHREFVRKAALTWINGTKISMSPQAGIYVYFFIHGSKLVKNGGKIGMIVSDAWLDMKYGIDLKKFFLDNFKIKYLITMDKGVFELALVNTVIVILEKAAGSEYKRARDENNVKFIRIKKTIHVDEVIRKVKEINTNYEDEGIRIVVVKQKYLKPEEPWSVFFRAPPVYFKIINHLLITRLSELARTRIGLQTFADKFYILSKEEVKKWSIEKEYLRPIITTPRKLNKLVIDDPNTGEYVLYCDKPKEFLKNTNVIKYIEYGEKVKVPVRKKGTEVVGYNNLPRVKQAKRKPWYNLVKEVKAKGIAPILLPRRMWKRVFFIWNKSNIIDNQSFIGIIPYEKDNVASMLAILNSSIIEFIIRCKAHIYGGGVAELKPKDVENLHIIDVRKLSEADKAKLSNLWYKLVECYSQDRYEVCVEKTIHEIDRTLFELLKLNQDDMNQIYHTIKEVFEVQRGVGREKEVIIRTIEYEKEEKIRKRMQRRSMKEKGRADKGSFITLDKFFGNKSSKQS